MNSLLESLTPEWQNEKSNIINLYTSQIVVSCTLLSLCMEFRRNRSRDNRHWWSYVVEIEATIALPFQSSLTTLLLQWRQRNVPKSVLHFALSSLVALARKTILDMRRLRLKKKRPFDKNARRNRRPQVPIQRLTIHKQILVINRFNVASQTLSFANDCVSLDDKCWFGLEIIHSCSVFSGATQV